MSFEWPETLYYINVRSKIIVTAPETYCTSKVTVDRPLTRRKDREKAKRITGRERWLKADATSATRTLRLCSRVTRVRRHRYHLFLFLSSSRREGSCAFTVDGDGNRRPPKAVKFGAADLRFSLKKKKITTVFLKDKYLFRQLVK